MSLELISTQIYWLAIYAIILMGVSELTTKSKSATILIVIFPFLIIPMLAGTTFNGWFNIAKSFTLVFVVIYGTIVRFNFKKKWAMIVLALMLHLNILEAVLKDLQSANFINVISGVIVLLLLPWPSKLKISEKTGQKPAQISYPMSWVAIIAYCLWHMCFMYSYESVRGIKGDYLWLNIVLLGIPLLVAFYQNHKVFFQVRLYTLAFVVILVEATLTRQPEIWPLSPNLYSPTVYMMISIFVFLSCCGCIGYLIKKQPQQLADTPLGVFFRQKEKRQILVQTK